MNFRTFFLGCALALVAACGDDGASTAIDAAVDAVDATPCELTGYPAGVRPIDVTLQQRTTLTLDGSGTRCEQIVRALLHPTGRPPELAQLDAAGATGTCEHDDVLDREIVRIRAEQYAGLIVYRPVQDVLAHVDATNAVVFLAGQFLPAGMAPATACLGGAQVGALVPGRPLGYQRFAACQPQGEGAYTIATDDELEVQAEGVFLDETGALRRVRAVDVYLLASHVNSEITNSDAYCCTGPTPDHCVGQRLFVDALTGETVGQEPHCHIC